LRLEIVFNESRLFMEDEILGKVFIPIAVIPVNAVVIEWVPLGSMRPAPGPVDALLVLHLDMIGHKAFDGTRAPFLEAPPWDATEVADVDTVKLPKGLRPPEPEREDALAAVRRICAENFGS
jgi:hypothetical protein